MPVSIPFAGAAHDRAGHRRPDATWLARARMDACSRVIILTREGALVAGDVGGMGPDDWYAPQGGRLKVARLTVADGIPEDAVLLGTDDAGHAVFAVDRLPDTAARPDDVQALDVRAAAALLPASEAGLLAQANTLLHWHRTTRFCGSCGEPTQAREGGHLLVCKNGHQHHPRTDPVVIMLVVDQERDRVLLGRQPSWPPRRYSALAGFVEPGEALEAAVAREVLEEAQVQVGAVRYVASQPWPFPASLMLGFEADYAAGEAAVGDEELDDVRWCSRDEVIAAAAAESERSGDAPLLLPPKLAIARHLIDTWLAAV
ncbi:MAG: diphosphatase [Solirubrobacterales bacterium]|nr:diphosphatase [Solirubrobacterales bacterium]